MQQFLSFLPEAAAARAAGTPVVALESTIISHGMPYPHIALVKHNAHVGPQLALALQQLPGLPAFE